MTQLERAIEILETLNEFFQEDNAVYPGALLLDDDTTIKDAVAECLQMEAE